MSAISLSQRIELSPAVRAVLEAGSPTSELLQRFVRYLQALLDPNTAGLDNVVTPDVRCHELEALGIPRGREGLKMFRRQANPAMPDEHIMIATVSFEGTDIIEVDMVMNATHRGEFLGIPATGGNFASMSMSALGLSMANWPSAGPGSTSKTSSASLPARFSRAQDGKACMGLTATPNHCSERRHRVTVAIGSALGRRR